MTTSGRPAADQFRRDRIAIFDPAAPPDWLSDHPMPHLLLQAWIRWRGARSAPARADIDPCDIPSLLPFVILLNVVPGDFQFRLCGETVNNRYRNRLKGRCLRELLSGPALQETLYEHDRCAADGQAVLVLNSTDTTSLDDTQSYVRLLLPIGPLDNGRTGQEDGPARHILGVMSFLS